jgi:hypothetical protein
MALPLKMTVNIGGAKRPSNDEANRLWLRPGFPATSESFCCYLKRIVDEIDGIQVNFINLE